MARILIIEDDITFTRILEAFLSRHAWQVTVTHNIKDGIRELRNAEVVLLDYRLPDGTGMDVLASIQRSGIHIPVIIMTSFSDIRTAVKAMRMGAYEYITKPVNPDELLMILKEALREDGTAGNAAKDMQFIRGSSEQAAKLEEHIRLVAPTDLSVIIQGDSGTGKELAARTIHHLSKRSGKAFVALDCGALSPDLASSELFGHKKGSFTGALHDKKGLFEAADGGTLFLDEVGNLDYEVQVKLLRTLQERVIQPVGSNSPVRVNVRVITATNDDLINAVKEGRFREDLYHRLNEFKIDIPSLKERIEDLDLLTDHFVNLANKELGKDVSGLSPDVRDIFHHYDWPGNIRELKNIIRRAVLLSDGDTIGKEALPGEMVLFARNPPGPDLKSMQAFNEREQIIRVLKEVKYNKSKAARLLNIDRTTLYYKMSKYNIEG